MKTAYKHPGRYSLWQYLVLAFTLIFMTLSALPNWYGEQPTVRLSSEQKDATALTPNALTKQLGEQGIEVTKVVTENYGVTIYLQQQDQQQHAQQVLKAAYNDDYSTALAMKSAAPAWLSDLGMNPVKLGLDLRGGVRFLLKVDTAVAVKEQLEQIQSHAKQLIRSNRLYGATAQVIAGNKVELSYKESQFDGMKAVKKTLRQSYPQLDFSSDGPTRFVIAYGEQAIAQFETEVMAQNLHTLRDRIEELGITEAVTQRKGKNHIRIELPGVQDPSEAKRIIGATAALDFHEVKATGGKVFLTKEGKEVSLKPLPLLSGKHIKDARAAFSDMGVPEVHLVLDETGGKIMTKHSQKNVGNPMVTVFTDYTQDAQGRSIKTAKIINMATITSVLGSRFSITNMQSAQAAQELALLLRAGSLTAPVTIEAESTIGPTLGHENINNGLAALALGLAVILIFMGLWYRRLGAIANIALGLNLICLLGLMSLIPGAVLTLPGIAGLVLTVGMAVDTNVLIFERIKEESNKGRSVLQAVDQGYSNAFATILDANITTLITAGILYGVGYGPVKGFAITLGLGILTSMFTGVFASRAMTNIAMLKSKKLLKGVCA